MTDTTTAKASSTSVAAERFATVDHRMAQFDYREHALVEALITAQQEYGFLSRELLTYVSNKLKVPMSQVYGVATFYDKFSLDAPITMDCMVCTGPVCGIKGGEDILEGVSKQTDASSEHRIHHSPCLGLCDQAPAAMVNRKAQVNLSVSDIPAMLRGEAQQPTIRVSGQPREITGLIGVLEATDLEAHRASGAFSALEKALSEMTPVAVIDEVKASRLAGRGGAGFSTGLKWEFTRKAAGECKYVVCNFDESEPGTFKDRALMEGDPYRVLEGLIISGYATGANTGIVFIRDEYPAADKIIKTALDKMHMGGLLGDDILGTGFSFDIQIRHNAGAYICGEETALFEAIEGKRGNPRHKPPYPTQSGLFGKPTAINNVETLAVIPSLIINGGKWFQNWGTEQSVGLKLFSLSGHINQPGVVEVPFGLTIRELIEGFGGGFDGEPQAILVGGAAGGFLHPDHFDTPITNEDLGKLDVPVGSGALMVFNQTVDLWQLLEGVAYFFVHEGCGQCTPCRIGMNQIYKFIQNFNQGEGSSADMQKAINLGQMIKGTCVCGLGMTAASPFLTFLDNIETTLEV